jgi:hypothetical protein
MPTYRARSCPNCNYYIGVTVTHAPRTGTEAPVNGLCLNCGYEVPVRAIVIGKKAPLLSKAHRSRSPLAPSVSQKARAPRESQEKPALGAGASRFRHYASDLRAIGQKLETLQHKHFNIECRGASYLVWPRNSSLDSPEIISSPQKEGRLENFLKPARLSSHTPPYRYDPADIDRIDRAGKAKRQPGVGITDGHSLSQLLRTLGTLLSRRGQKLLAISWQDASISVVVESPRGERQLDVYRRDHLYDGWVKGYLQRAGRAYSDVPT